MYQDHLGQAGPGSVAARTPASGLGRAMLGQRQTHSDPVPVPGPGQSRQHFLSLLLASSGAGRSFSQDCILHPSRGLRGGSSTRLHEVGWGGQCTV